MYIHPGNSFGATLVIHPRLVQPSTYSTSVLMGTSKYSMLLLGAELPLPILQTTATTTLTSVSLFLALVRSVFILKRSRLLTVPRYFLLLNIHNTSHQKIQHFIDPINRLKTTIPFWRWAYRHCESKQIHYL